MKRFHHTDAEELDLKRKYEQTYFKKPLGVWYDIDGSWLGWRKDNEYHPHKNSFLLVLDEEDMLIIDSVETFKAFDAEFAYTPDELKGISGDYRRIDWARLAKYYTGIEIAPHQEFDRLLEMPFWYMGWDVASGCVWDLSIIKSAVKLQHLEVTNL